jgi:hypothetical protein
LVITIHRQQQRNTLVLHSFDDCVIGARNVGVHHVAEHRATGKTATVFASDETHHPACADILGSVRLRRVQPLRLQNESTKMLLGRKHANVRSRDFLTIFIRIRVFHGHEAVTLLVVKPLAKRAGEQLCDAWFEASALRELQLAPNVNDEVQHFTLKACREQPQATLSDVPRNLHASREPSPAK